MDKAHISQHISSQFNRELQELFSTVMQMGELVQAQIGSAVHSLVTGDVELGEKVITSDHLINAMEVRIDEECAHIIARRQPTATDLRFIIAMAKSTTDLERMGDEAERIGHMAVRLGPAAEEPSRRFAELGRLGRNVQQQLADALRAMDTLDTELAAHVVREDRSVDADFEGLTRELITHMMEDPRSIPRALNVIWAARSLERIGDRARNLCEYVIYIVKGKDVRHTSLEDLEREARSTD
ncbi:MAG: phosphate signaling complex protein PhoU [Gammaproteobacteria bacterium]|nr:phosphate signaling complex protein PhoU [Gammaproteobacteria bacterium]